MIPALALGYLLAANLAAFAAFARDKRNAVIGRRRIPERTLLGLAAAGGSLGALMASGLLRHKTRKAGFSAWLWLIAGAHAALAVAIAALLAS